MKHEQADAKTAENVLTHADTFFPFSRALRPDATRGKIEIFIAPSEESFQKLTGGMIPHWGTACAFPTRGLIVLKSPRLVNVWKEPLEIILRHELVHIYLHRISPRGLPRWFDEGAATYLSGEWGLRDNLDLAIAVLTGNLIPLADMNTEYPSAESRVNLFYIQSYSTVAFLASHLRTDHFMSFFHRMLTSSSFESALYQQTGLTLQAFEKKWEGWLKRNYHPLYLLGRSEFLFIFLLLMLFVAYIAKRRRLKKTIAAMDDEFDNNEWME